MLHRFFNRLKDIFLPFSQIAKELAIIREMYELELSSRNPPIIRVTEEPRRGDTEVSYTDDKPKAKSALKRMLEGWDDEDGDVLS